MRKDPPFDMEYVYSTYLLEAAEREGARVFNRPRAIRDHNEKLAIAEFATFIAPTLVTRDAARIARVHRRAWRHDRQAARRDGRDVGVPRQGGRRPEPQRDRRDGRPRRRADRDGAALHPGDRRRRQAGAADRRRARPVRARAHPEGRARRAATSRRAAVASPARSPRATARSPPRSGRGCGPRACSSSGWTSSATA